MEKINVKWSSDDEAKIIVEIFIQFKYSNSGYYFIMKSLMILSNLSI